MNQAILILTIEILLAVATFVLGVLWLLYPDRPGYEPIILLTTTVIGIVLEIIRRNSKSGTTFTHTPSQIPQSKGRTTPRSSTTPNSAESKYTIHFNSPVTAVQVNNESINSTQSVNEPKP